MRASWILAVGALIVAPALRSSAAEQTPIAPPLPLPVTVAVGIYFVDFDSIDVPNQNFEAMGYLSLRWQDPRLAFDSAVEGVKVKYYEKDAIWNPIVEMVNAQEEQIMLEENLAVAPDGTVTQYSRFVNLFNSEFDLRQFPFDTQSLLVIIESFRYDASVVRFIEDEQRSGLSEEAFLAEWRFHKLVATGESRWFPPDQSDFSRLTFVIEAEREWEYYFWKMIMPLTLTVIISWITFWVDIVDLQTELGVSITLLLTMVAFSITLDFQLPKVSYLTWMNKFQFLCFAFVFLVAIENVIVKNVETNRAVLARSLRVRSRWIFPLAFVVLNVIIFDW